MRGGDEDEIVSLAVQPSRACLDFLDACLKACSLSAGKDTPDPYVSEHKWLERVYFDF